MKKDEKVTVFFFPNGNTAVCVGDEQQPKLQKSWLITFAKHLVANGIDPTKVEFNMPGGAGIASVFKTPIGYNWRFGRDLTMKDGKE